MTDFFVVNDVLRTTTGTQDFTVAGFGTPSARAAMFLVSLATSDGTAVNTATIGFGFTDGTRQTCIMAQHRDTVTSAACNARDDACIFISNAGADGNLLGTFNSWITNGIRLNITASGINLLAYRVTGTLIGGTGVSNVYVGTKSSPATQDTATTNTDPGFPADFLVTGSIDGANPTNFDEIEHGNAWIEVGIVQNTGSEPPPQGSSMFASISTATSDVRSEFVSVYAAGEQTAALSVIEIKEFSPTGFKLYTRQAAGARMMMYLAVKLNGLSAKYLQFDTPTSGGAQSISGIGFTSQFAFLLENAIDVIDVQQTDTDAEVWGLGVITDAAQACHAIYSQDNVNPSNTESVAHTRPIFLRRAAGTFMDATFTSFGGGVVNLTVNTANGTARKWAGLFVSSGGGGATRAFLNAGVPYMKLTNRGGW